MFEKMKVAGVQIGAFSGSYEENMENITALIQRVAEEERPDLIVCSELMTAPYFAAVSIPDDAFFSYAEEMAGPTVQRIQALAEVTGAHIVGTLFEKEKVDTVYNYFNTAFVCSPTRGVIGRYRKVHVPKVEVSSMKTDEKYYFERFGGGGQELPVFTLDNGCKIGILICFDRSFPEAWKALAMQGTDLIVVPTATFGFRKDLYVEELRVRALENNVFVLGVNKAGEEHLLGEILNRKHFGLSCLIDPFGDKQAVANEDGWTYVSGMISSETIASAKSRIDFMKERKPDIYQKYLQ